MKSIWKCRPHCGRHFDVGFINQALLAKVSLLDKAPFCGSKKLLLSVGIPTNQIGTWFISTTLVDKGELESARRSSACFASSRDACIYAYDVSFDKGSLVY